MGVESRLYVSNRGKRAAQRARVFLRARLQTPSGPVEARIRDISSLGALVECDRNLPIGTAAVFKRGDVAVAARVAWSAGCRVGLEFDVPVDERELLVKLRQEKPTDRPSKRFEPAQVPKGLTRVQRQLAEVWGVTVGLNVSASLD